MSQEIDAAKEAALLAGNMLLENFRKDIAVEEKSDHSFVTELDRRAESLIIDYLASKFPSHGFLGEESGPRGSMDGLVWIIDPLDGTHNYIRKSPVFGVSIGAWLKDEFVAGVIYMPCDHEIYTAEKGSGAFKNDTKIHVSQAEDLSQVSLSFDSSLKRDADLMIGVLHHLAPQCFNIRMTGSSARLMSYIAEGVFDAGVEFHDSPWDFAAGACIVKEAGGIVTEPSGQTLSLQSRGYVAAHPAIHKKITALIQTDLYSKNNK